MAVSRRIENVAYFLAFSKGMVGDFVVLVVSRICKRNQEFSSGESIEVLGCVSFNPRLIPNGRLFALGVDLLDDLIEIT